jgi:hypothetical protein
MGEALGAIMRERMQKQKQFAPHGLICFLFPKPHQLKSSFSDLLSLTEWANGISTQEIIFKF